MGKSLVSCFFDSRCIYVKCFADSFRFLLYFIAFVCFSVCRNDFLLRYKMVAFSALTLLVGHHEEQPACKNWVMRCCRVLVWLSVWSEVQIICIGSSWCHFHPLSCLIKSRLVSPFSYRLTHVVLEKSPLNGVCVKDGEIIIWCWCCGRRCGRRAISSREKNKERRGNCSSIAAQRSAAIPQRNQRPLVVSMHLLINCLLTY